MTETSPARPSVVVIGGGYAGVNVAKALDDIADVTLVEPKDAFVHNVASLRALVDTSWLPRTYFPYGSLLSRGRVVRDRAVKAEAGHVTLGSGDELRADYLVIASGSQYPFPAKSDVDDTAEAHGKSGPRTPLWPARAGSCWWAPGRSASNWPARSPPRGRASR